MRVSDTHSSLCHYTTAPGLEGIVREQQLRATNIGFLNDSEERIGYFKRRLPNLIKAPVHDAVNELLLTPAGAKVIVEEGGAEQIEAKLINFFCETFQNQHEQLDDPYVASFCVSDAQHPDDGLLSQWRGYGEDGGYAIVFNTRKIEDCIVQEQKFNYQGFFIADVEYADPSGCGAPRYTETVGFEDNIKESVRQFILTRDSGAFAPMYTAMSALPCVHKHRGFSEEGEVRIVAIPIHDELHAKSIVAGGDDRPRKPVQFRSHNGLLVPYLNLFGPGSGCEALPIEKVIVGPHPDALRRKKSVEMLLAAHAVEAIVIISAIPYIGR